jgi:PAS domain S-box-containing protein
MASLRVKLPSPIPTSLDMAQTAERRKIYRRADDLYRKSIEEVKDYAIFMTDPDGRVTNWNLGAQHILGFREWEIIGLNAAIFFTPEDRERDEHEKELRKAITEGRAEDERWHLRKSGQRFWASGVVTPVRDGEGELVGFCKVMRDMTERKRVEEERDRLFVVAMDMMCIVQFDGHFKRVNPAFQTLLGFTEEELLAIPLFELVHPDDRAKTIAEYEKLAQGEPTKLMENRLRCRDGSYSWVAWSYFPIADEGIAYGVGRDITQLKQMHEVLRLRAEELVHANRLKDEFLATLSHELRTPLTSIVGWSRLLSGNQLDEQNRARAIQIIQRNAEAQSNLIEDLLDVSRIMTGKMKIDMRPLAFSPIVEAVVHDLRPSAEAKRLELETDIDVAAGQIMGDPIRLQQIVTNLLSNAIKFTPEGGQVKVELRRVDSHARLRVSDTGIGISPESLPHIFERFNQADSSTTRSYSGLGLGLAIVDHLVRQQRGTVMAVSEGAGKGSVFTVEFPLASTELINEASLDVFSSDTVAALNQGGFASDAIQDVKVLLVEDEPDSRELLTTILKACGAIVTAVSSSEAALREVNRVIPDVVVSDIGMPGESGYDLIDKIRALPPDRGGRVPAVALTAYASASDRRRALLAGFHTHLAKPVEPDELLTVLSTLAAQGKSHK